jgi:hypothetical protein
MITTQGWLLALVYLVTGTILAVLGQGEMSR